MCINKSQWCTTITVRTRVCPTILGCVFPLIAKIIIEVLVEKYFCYCTITVKWVVFVKLRARMSTIVIPPPRCAVPISKAAILPFGVISGWVTTNVYTMNLNGFCPTIIPKMIILLPYKTRIKRFGCIYEQSLQTFVPNDNDDPLCWHTPICTGQNLHTYIPKVYNIQHVQQTRVSNNTWLCLYIDIMHNPPGRVSKLLLILYKYGQMGSARQNPYTDLHNWYSPSQMCHSNILFYVPSIQMGNNQRLHNGFEWILSNNAHQF